ncbi:MAG: hypothetical protein U0Q16_20965 [Bryobacteraceae bacterium]
MGHVCRDGRCWLLLLALAYLPSAWIASQFADMPQLGSLHDDGLYVANARSLAEHGEYRLASFPGQPWQTKYPPLYSLVLAAALRTGGGTAALSAVACASIALMGLLSWIWYRHSGLAPPVAAVTAALILLTPLVVFIGLHTLADVLFTALIIACVIAAERDRPLAAGVLAGLAYLTRAAALPLLVTSPLVYLLSGKRTSAARFAMAMFPFVAAWTLWSGAHRPAHPDPVQLYYFDYFGFYRANVSLGELPALIQSNLWEWLTGIGSLTIPYAPPSMLRPLLIVVAVGCFAGLKRMYAAGAWRRAHYLWFAAGFAILLLVWNFPPNRRFSIPIYPLLLAGLGTELRTLGANFVSGWRNTAGANRVAAGVGMALFAVGGPAWIWYNASAIVEDIPAHLLMQRASIQRHEPVYGWIRSNAELGARIYAYDDAVLFAQTGRPSMAFHPSTRFSYHEDQAGLVAELAALPEKVRMQRLDYVLLTNDDFHRESVGAEAARLIARLKTSPGWTPVVSTPHAVLYRVPPPDVARTHP